MSFDDLRRQWLRDAIKLDCTRVHAELYLHAVKVGNQRVVDYVLPILRDSARHEWGKCTELSFTTDSIVVKNSEKKRSVTFCLDANGELKDGGKNG